MSYRNLQRNHSNFLNNSKWFYLNTGINSGAFNMSCDSYLLNSVLEDKIKLPILRIYGWNKPTLSLGIHQLLSSSDNCKYSHYPVVKRITGGQAVLHGISSDELTYSICLRYFGGVKTFYKIIGEVLLSFLQKCGLRGTFGYNDNNYRSCFDCFDSRTSADIVINDIKVIGSAQHRIKNVVLQHGAIRLDKIRELSGNKLNFDTAEGYLKKLFEICLNISFQNYQYNENIYALLKD